MNHVRDMKKNHKKQQTKPVSAKAFRNKDNFHVFPFVCLDSTPGGKNIGKITWEIELIPAKNRKNIQTILVSAKQTRDERYAGKIFEIKADTLSIMGVSGTLLSGRKEMTIFGCTWRAGYCQEHRGLILFTSPKFWHTKLVIPPPFSSIGSDIYFE